MLKLIAPAALAVLLLGACETQVKQQRPPRIPGTDEKSDFGESNSSDIVDEPEDDSAVPVEEEKLTKEQKRARKRMKCCNECVEARKKDRSPDKAEKIPCADYTADVGESCRKWFLKSPMMASEAQACVKEAPPEGGDKPAAAAGDAKK